MSAEPASVTANRDLRASPAAQVAGTRNTVPPRICAECERPIGAEEPVCFWGGRALWTGERWFPDHPWCEPCLAHDLRQQDERSGVEKDADDYDPFGWWFKLKTCAVCGRPQRGGGGSSHVCCSDECRRRLPTILRRRKREAPTEFDCANCGNRIRGTLIYKRSPWGRSQRTTYCEPCFVASRIARDTDSLARHGRDGPFGLYRGGDHLYPGDDGYDPLERFERRRCGPCGREVIGRAVCSDRCEYEALNQARHVTPEERACAVCGDAFTPKRSDARYCSNACRQDAYRMRKRGAT